MKLNLFGQAHRPAPTQAILFTFLLLVCSLRAHAAEGSRPIIDKVIVSNRFLTDCAPAMLSKKGIREFDLYLLFLRDWQYSTHGEWMDIDFDKAAAQAAIPIDNKAYEHRYKIRTSIKELGDKYHLLEYRFDTKHDVAVRFPETPRRKYFSIPLAYWQYGLNLSLTSGERFFFLISLHEHDLVRGKPYWRRSIPGLMRIYHMSNSTFSDAIMGLRRADILEVKYDTLKGWGRNASRSPNEYRLKPLISPKERNKRWVALDALYGHTPVTKARALLELIDMGNDHAAAEQVVLLIKECGENAVKAAFMKASMFEPSNPIRSFDYVRGLARKQVRESL